MTYFIVAVSFIFGLFLGRWSRPKPPIDPKEFSAVKEEARQLKEDLALFRKRYTDLRLRHNKLVDLVSGALDKKTKKK